MQPTLSIATLGNGSAQWTLKTRADGYYLFDGTGSLNRHVRVDGKTVSYAQSGNTLTVSASSGDRKIVYTKDATTGMYVSALLPDAQLITFDVDAFGAVKSVTYPDTNTKRHLYNETTLRGTSAEAPVRLTGLVDENGVRQSTFTYSGNGDAVSTERVGGVDKYSIAVQSPNVTLTKPLGSASTLRWETGLDGERRMTSQSQPAGSGCAAGSQTISYDSNGNVAKKTDFAGELTCHVSDLARNLETTRVEGLASAANCSSVTPDGSTLPAGSRKATTAWHPDWGLASKVSEPSRITTNVYNGQPDPFNSNTAAACAPVDALLPDGKPIAVLCKTVQQATTDADGHLGFAAALQSGVVNQEQSWTYNQYGQILMAMDSLNAATTYAYYAETAFTGVDPNAVGHTIGDLLTITDAKGFVTTFNAYDKSGRVLQMTDPKGIVTAMTYTPRGWINTVTVTPPGGAARVTTYTYDAVGQVTGVSNPDGTTIGYTYDAAHRLVGAIDAKGNSVNYTLDNVGNRIAEQLKDPSGVLQRTMSRSFDALNRVQQLQLQ